MTLTGLLLSARFAGSGHAGDHGRNRGGAQQRTSSPIAATNAKIDDLRIKQKDLETAFASLARKKAITRVVSDLKSRSPALNWILAYLSEAVPDGLVLTQLQVAQQTNLWSVHLAGRGESTTNHVDALRAGC